MTPVRSRLLPARKLGSDDAQIVAITHTLPAPTLAPEYGHRIGITNAAGEVYREILVYNALELVELTARLNAVGYLVSEEARQFRYRYARVFRKPERGGD